MDAFYADLARVYREEIHALAALGCTYLQLDDPNMAYLCDQKMRAGVREGKASAVLEHWWRIKDASPGELTSALNLLDVL